MSHFPFILAAFAATILGTGWLVISSFFGMRRAEQLAKDVSERKKPVGSGSGSA